MPGLRRTRRATAAACTCAGFIGIMLLGPALAGAPSAGQMAYTDSSGVTSLEVNASVSSKTGQITCFGDSWAAFACPTLSSTVAKHLHRNKVVNKGVPGSTASVWANDTNVMLAQILSGGVPSFVWLSIGGNDILDGWASGACSGNASSPSAAACYADILASTDTMLHAIFHALPLVQVVHFGYDFTNFVSTSECNAYGVRVFGKAFTGQAVVNEIFLGYAKHVLAPLQAKYNMLSYQAPALWGTLQRAGGSATTPPPYPNVAYPSPLPLMNDGCIHASKQGWEDLMGALYDAYFKARLG